MAPKLPAKLRRSSSVVEWKARAWWSMVGPQEIWESCRYQENTCRGGEEEGVGQRGWRVDEEKREGG